MWRICSRSHPKLNPRLLLIVKCWLDSFEPVSSKQYRLLLELGKRRQHVQRQVFPLRLFWLRIMTARTFDLSHAYWGDFTKPGRQGQPEFHIVSSKQSIFSCTLLFTYHSNVQDETSFLSSGPFFSLKLNNHNKVHCGGLALKYRAAEVGF